MIGGVQVSPAVRCKIDELQSPAHTAGELVLSDAGEEVEHLVGAHAVIYVVDLWNHHRRIRG